MVSHIFKIFIIDRWELASKPSPKYKQRENKSRAVSRGQSYNSVKLKIVCIKTGFEKRTNGHIFWLNIFWLTLCCNITMRKSAPPAGSSPSMIYLRRLAITVGHDEWWEGRRECCENTQEGHVTRSGMVSEHLLQEEMPHLNLPAR